MQWRPRACEVVVRGPASRRVLDAPDARIDARAHRSAWLPVQGGGAELPAFAYVWGDEHRHLLSAQPWSFDDFLRKDFATYWKAELEEDLGISLQDIK